MIIINLLHPSLNVTFLSALREPQPILHSPHHIRLHPQSFHCSLHFPVLCVFPIWHLTALPWDYIYLAHYV